MAVAVRGAQQSARPAALFLCTLAFFFLRVSTVPVSALNVGYQDGGSGISVSVRCSTTCESDFCSLPPLLRYGKYCGILYSGCPGEKPCDDLDACCQTHDACVQSKNDYLNLECNRNLLSCIERFRESGKPAFKGNKCIVTEVVDIISLVIEGALLAGSAPHHP